MSELGMMVYRMAFKWSPEAWSAQSAEARDGFDDQLCKLMKAEKMATGPRFPKDDRHMHAACEAITAKAREKRVADLDEVGALFNDGLSPRLVAARMGRSLDYIRKCAADLGVQV